MNDAAHPAFRFLNDIAADLARGQVTFPTFTHATMRVREVLSVPDVDADRVAQAVSTEPLLAARIVRVANSVAMNPAGKQVGDVKSAIVRIGFAAVRSASTTVALEQLRGRLTHPHHIAFAERAWRHSVRVAAVAHVLAKRLSRVHPDEALFAGLVHDIGHFYLLSQASKYPELERAPQELEALLADWHPSIGQAVLHDFRLPDAVLEAVAEHENGHYRLPLRALSDIVTLANLASAATNPVARYREVPPGKLVEPDVMAVLASDHAEIEGLAAALSA
ncbi:MAG TPA: HDOD domain-containing protein [Casimicrobiaceae bacterium]|nr:HDOD domain-containing protein [Casimicrobiaceae bacterium]